MDSRTDLSNTLILLSASIVADQAIKAIVAYKADRRKFVKELHDKAEKEKITNSLRRRWWKFWRTPVPYIAEEFSEEVFQRYCKEYDDWDWLEAGPPSDAHKKTQWAIETQRHIREIASAAKRTLAIDPNAVIYLSLGDHSIIFNTSS